MGGGGAMRAAAKVASFGVNAGLRGIPSVPLAEQSVATRARKPSMPTTTIVSSVAVAADEGRTYTLLSSQNGKIEASFQRPLLDMDEWEFADDEDDLLLDSIAPMPRVVFGGVPTLEEAEEATSELKDSIDQVFFSSNSSSGLETKVDVPKETAVATPLVPEHAIQAFLLLKESPAAQSVVASLASDKNVWDAVMQNPKVAEFFQCQQTSDLSRDMDMNDKESCADNRSNERESLKVAKDASSGSFERGLMCFIDNIRLTATEMVKNVSDFIETLFGGSLVGNATVDENGSRAMTIGSSFMALAVLAIMVVLLKRA